MSRQDYASKTWLQPRPPALRRWHVLALLAALLLLVLTSDPTDCDGRRCTTSFDTAAQSR
jgi:hypothetical protein